MVNLLTPEPGPDEILIRIKVCGVCHTDLHTIEDELQQVERPIISSHQEVGIVEKSGEKASRFQEGERVGAAWLYSADGSCPFCLKHSEF